MDVPLNTCQNSRNIVCRTPPVLQNIQTQLSSCINIRMKHLANELDGGGLVWILFLEGHDKSKSSIFKGSVCRTDNDGVPNSFIIGIKFMNIRFASGETNQSITLSATGDAETPAGGSVCMRCR